MVIKLSQYINSEFIKEISNSQDNNNSRSKINNKIYKDNIKEYIKKNILS
jgi:hypothetical protein